MVRESRVWSCAVFSGVSMADCLLTRIRSVRCHAYKVFIYLRGDQNLTINTLYFIVLVCNNTSKIGFPFFDCCSWPVALSFYWRLSKIVAMLVLLISPLEIAIRRCKQRLSSDIYNIDKISLIPKYGVVSTHGYPHSHAPLKKQIQAL